MNKWRSLVHGFPIDEACNKVEALAQRQGLTYQSAGGKIQGRRAKCWHAPVVGRRAEKNKNGNLSDGKLLMALRRLRSLRRGL